MQCAIIETVADIVNQRRFANSPLAQDCATGMSASSRRCKGRPASRNRLATSFSRDEVGLCHVEDGITSGIGSLGAANTLEPPARLRAAL